MKLSTRSRYGLRLLFELALHYDAGKYLLLKDISESQEISEKYLSNIIIPLKSSKFVISARGAHGGYILGKRPEDINIKEVIDTLEGTSLVVDCITGSESCGREKICPTQELWKKLESVIDSFLKGVTLKDLVNDYSKKVKGKEEMYFI